MTDDGQGAVLGRFVCKLYETVDGARDRLDIDSEEIHRLTWQAPQCFLARDWAPLNGRHRGGWMTLSSPSRKVRHPRVPLTASPACQPAPRQTPLQADRSLRANRATTKFAERILDQEQQRCWVAQRE